jgi:hypothetical protein
MSCYFRQVVDMKNGRSYILELTLPSRQISKEGVCNSVCTPLFFGISFVTLCHRIYERLM